MSRALSRAGAARMSRAAVLLAAVPLIAGMLAACTGPPMPTPTPTTSPTPTGDGVLRIGTLFSMSGPLAGYGAGQTAAVNAAVREVDAAGGVLGVPVEVVNRDGGDPATVGAAFDALIAKGVDVVIGPTSSESAAVLLPMAAAAHVPLVSPSANATALAADGAGWFFRTIPTPGAQGAVLAGLLADRDALDVALIRDGDDAAAALAQALTDGLAAAEGDLAADVRADLAPVADPADPAAPDPAAGVVAEATAGDPDAVVLATADDGAVTPALVAALAAAGYAGQKLWLVGRGLTDTTAIPAGALAGANALTDGFTPDAVLAARFRLEDPGAGSLRYAAEAYDAVILAALAARLAGDDGGASIARSLPAASADGIPCASFGECLDVLSTEPDIDYTGVTGPVDLGGGGELTRPGFGLFSYAADNMATFAEWVAR
jgi:branched-chain amino acid transport system substrate-binding protein